MWLGFDFIWVLCFACAWICGRAAPFPFYFSVKSLSMASASPSGLLNRFCKEKEDPHRSVTRGVFDVTMARESEFFNKANVRINSLYRLAGS